MARYRILVIEDDHAIRQGVVDALTFEGYDVVEVADGLKARQVASGLDCDLVLLDLVLPGCDGLEILAEIRASRPTLPVVILTARGAEADRVRGLKLGADDYVVKPFSVVELLARVEAVIRRSPDRPEDVKQVPLACGVADLARCEIRYDDGTRVELSEREGRLLRYLAMHAGRAISRDEILARVWQLEPRGITTRTIDMHVARLRDKLRDDPDEPNVIRTVRGKGYMFAQVSASA